MRKVIILIIAAVFLIVAGISICAVAVLRIDPEKISGKTGMYVTKTYTMDESFEDIRITADTENITIQRSQDGLCSVECYENENRLHSVAVRGDTLVIGINDRIDITKPFVFETDTPEITVYLPGTAYDDLNVSSDTGRVVISDGFTFEEMEIKTDTGAINIDGCLAEEISLKSSTGNINLTGSDAEEISIKTDTGNITGSLLSAKTFVTKSDTGTISVPDSGGRGKCKMTTSTGNIKMTVE